jgi:hypothetical protein
MWPLLRKILPILFVVAYFLSPFDLVPDFLIGPGWIDDILLVVLLIWFLSGRSVPLFGRFGSPYGGSQAGNRRTSHRNAYTSTGEDEDTQDLDDPYAVLGIRRGATDEEIKEAYRVAAAKYHPDKVTHLGKEFQRLAHQRFVAIQQAYERLTKAR